MRILILLLVSIILFSCSTTPKKSPEEIAKANIEENLMRNLHDASSYEFVELGKLDTIYAKEHYQELEEEYTDLLLSMQDYPNKIEELQDIATKFRNYGSEYESEAKEAEELIAGYIDDYEKTQKNLAKYRELSQNSQPDEILDITTTLRCRANNKMGAKVLAIYDVVLSDSLTVKSIDQQ